MLLICELTPVATSLQAKRDGQADEHRQKRVLDEVLTLVFPNETCDKILHDCVLS